MKQIFELSSRLPNNAPGPWFISDDCIICGLCDELAPMIFRPDEDHCFNIVHRQPETTDEIELAEEAAEACPVEAILKESCER